MYKRGTKVIDLGDLIKLPKSIKIGDVMLLENLNEENEFRYVRDFDNLDWKGLISLRDVSGEEGKYKSLKVVYGDSRIYAIY